ncbi:MAG: 6-hydroxymethylpterin diphosphokinase MptE-like protein [Pseudomonadota bacterium]
MEDERSELVKKLPWSAEIFLPTDKLNIQQQVDGLKRVVDLNQNRLFQVYSQQLRALRDRYENTKRCFIVGNGPSLNKTDLSQLEGEVTFCVNGFFLKMPELNWTPTFYVVEDHLVAEDRADAINAIDGPTKLFPAYLAYCLDEGPNTIFFNHRGRISYPDGFDFSKDASRVTYTGCTVTFTCMQLAHYMGFREIYLIGVDASYEIPDDAKANDSYGTGILDMDSDDPNHFHPDYFGKGFRWHDPQVEKMIDAYTEARRVTDGLSRPIYNATLGGALEVFERRSYSDIFPSAISADQLTELTDSREPGNSITKRELEASAKLERAETHKSAYPKVALIDMTAAGGTTATGALKASLFSDWPRERLLQITSENNEDIYIQGAPITSVESHLVTRSAHHASQIVAAFDADVLLYRPLPELPILQNVYEQACAISGASRIVWMMDDWPAKLQFEGHPESEYWDAKLRAAFQSADALFSISDAMSKAYKLRYASAFIPIANGIDPAKWKSARQKTTRPYRIRYAGNLSDAMSLNTLLNLAKAVEVIAETHDVTLDIQTGEYWANLSAEQFASFKSTRLNTVPLSNSDYRAWMMEADLSVIAYNFDDLSKSYVRYSMANKLPELLASGSVLFAIGPEDNATIEYLSHNDLGIRVTTGSVDAIEEALSKTLRSSHEWALISQKQKQFAQTNLRLSDMRDKFSQQIRLAAKRRRSKPDGLNQAFLDFLVAPHSASLRFNARTMTKRPEHLKLSKPKRMLRFYKGWRGVIAGAAVLLSALPTLIALISNDWTSVFITLGPVAAVTLIVAFLAYLFTVLEDHHYQ